MIAQRDLHSPHRRTAINALAGKIDKQDGRAINWLLVALVCALVVGLAYVTGATTIIGRM